MIQFIIPAYGESPYLEECIQSLQNQTVTTDIVVTTSTPNAYIEKLAHQYKIPILVNNHGGSIAADWNFALSCASQPLAALTHQDDLYDKNFARNTIQFFSKHKDVAILFTDSREMINNQSKILIRRELIKLMIRKCAFLFSRVISKPSQYFRLLAFGCAIPCASVVYNLKHIQNMTFSNHLSVNLDWDFWCQIAKARKKIGYLPGFYLTHRIHGEAETQKAKTELRRHKEDAIIFSYFWPPFLVKWIGRLYQLGY